MPVESEKVVAANFTVLQHASALQLMVQITRNIDNKQILTGGLCNETVVERSFVWEYGVFRNEDVKVDVRRIPMVVLRKRIPLQDHQDKSQMRLHSFTFKYYSPWSIASSKRKGAMGDEMLLRQHSRNLSIASTLKYRHHHTRHLFLFNPHADMIASFVMMEILHVMYDKAVYLSDD